jgi:hypothetical protein
LCETKVLTNIPTDNANSSSTYQYIDSDLDLFYGSGDGATGDDASDILAIGSATIRKYRFGIQYKTTVGEGILGVSPFNPDYIPPSQGTAAEGHFPTALVANGIIASRAFSLWLNDERAASGQVLFGGVDTKKYRGNLVTIDMVTDKVGQPAYNYIIPLLSVTLTNANGATSTLTGGTAPGNTILDSGTNVVTLPTQLAKSIFTALGSDISSPFVLCSLAQTSTTLNFAFQGITIKAPISQFLGVPQGTQCQLLISADDGSPFILGDPMLTSMYIVYDIDNSQISLAPTVFNATDSNILQIMAGPSGVPKQPGVGGTTTSSISKTTSTPYITDTIGYPIRKATTYTLKPTHPFTVGVVVVVTPSPYPPPGKTASKPYYITNTIGYPIPKPTKFTIKPTSTFSVGVVVVVTPSPYPK